MLARLVRRTALGLVLAVGSAGAALAQIPNDSLTFTFTNAAPVPLSPWALAALFIALAVAAAVGIRRRGAARLFGLGLAVLLLGGALYAGKAEAGAASTVNLSTTTSGTPVQIGNGAQAVTVNNNTVNAVNVTAIQLTSGQFDNINAASSTCSTMGLTTTSNTSLTGSLQLNSNASCTVVIRSPA